MTKKSITDNFVETLKSVLGKELSLIYSNTLNYTFKSDNLTIMEPAIFGIGDDFFYIDHTEFETKDFEEYYILDIKKQLTPKPLPHDISELNSVIFKKPISTVSVWSTITQIIVYISEERENVRVNNEVNGIEFIFDNNKCLLLRPNSPSGSSITFNQKEITTFKKYSKEIYYID
ncbi:hypothetical protein LCM10_04270 [Rossellomorea aquimaris]|uniref:hypothetical protein n=1 Tax=Rossellomorea aquimaris TaxID=189382 RepID=UPI001CD8087E|nr:hypothetical protein [Rossellomorea aquimaris]MCA1054192.1 hypothetical protein [Rossellomorea aquimaris]